MILWEMFQFFRCRGPLQLIYFLRESAELEEGFNPDATRISKFQTHSTGRSGNDPGELYGNISRRPRNGLSRIFSSGAPIMDSNGPCTKIG